MFLLVRPFCSGGFGSGSGDGLASRYECALPFLEEIAAMVVASTFFVIPLGLPVIFYFWLINEWRIYRGKKSINIGIMLLILCGVVILSAIILAIFGALLT